MAQFIIVFGNAAIKKPAFIFIDEPEANLHPGLQIEFLTSLASYASKGIMFATHSIGLARSSADYIYSLNNLNGKHTMKPFEQIQNLPEFLGEMSYSSMQDVGGAGILCVEGITDIKTVKQFLRKLKVEHKYVILPLGGGQFINSKREHELVELQRITQNIRILIGSEKSSATEELSRDRQHFKRACDGLNIPCHILERRAIENYLSEGAIKQVKGNSYSPLTEYQHLKEINPCWHKSDNWQIAKEMDFSDIENTDLGEFLKGL